MIEPLSHSSHEPDRREEDLVDLSLAGDWVSEDTLESQPAKPAHDWLQEFAEEPVSPQAAPEPHRLVEPVPIDAWRDPGQPEQVARTVRSAPATPPRRRRLMPLAAIAASLLLVSLMKVPAVHRPWLLVQWDELGPDAPSALNESVPTSPEPIAVTASARDVESAPEPASRLAKQEPRPQLPPRVEPQPPPKRDVSNPGIFASAKVAAPETAPLSAPPTLAVRHLASLDGLLGRPTGAMLPAPPRPSAPAPPSHAETAPTLTPEAALRAARLAGVQSVIDHYRRAFNPLNANSVKAFWPGVDVRSLDRAFAQLELQRFEFQRCEIDLAGPRAFASCDGSARSVRKVGDRNPRAQAREWTFTLAQADDAWVILSVNSRPLQ